MRRRELAKANARLRLRLAVAEEENRVLGAELYRERTERVAAARSAMRRELAVEARAYKSVLFALAHGATRALVWSMCEARYRAARAALAALPRKIDPRIRAIVTAFHGEEL